MAGALSRARLGLAKVRGTRFNQGDGIRMALDAGAMPAGNWSGCHAVAWDRNAPEFGDLAVGDGFQKHSYPFSIVVNALGERFVDEGADFRNYTYAAYGRRVLEQPGQVAWQVFDARVTHLLRDEYRIRQVTKAKADTLEELAARMEGIDGARFLATVRAYNDAVMTEVPFDPTVKDGRGTRGVAPPKSNWANRIETPPFEAYAVTCGITFTFGGLAIDPGARVQAVSGTPIPGLYAAGELVGGLFYGNYPGGHGSGLGGSLRPSCRHGRCPLRKGGPRPVSGIAHRLHRHGRHGRAHVPQPRAQARRAGHRLRPRPGTAGTARRRWSENRALHRGARRGLPI